MFLVDFLLSVASFAVVSFSASLYASLRLLALISLSRFAFFLRSSSICFAIAFCASVALSGSLTE